MIHLTSGIGLVFEVGFAVFCFVDVLLAKETAVRRVPRWAWAVGILVFPLAGGAGYLAAGRARRAVERQRAAAGATSAAGGTATATAVAAGPTTAAAADGAHDAVLLGQLRELNEEHEAMLTRWEDDLRRREEQLRAETTRIGGTAAA
ncbi:PLDc N-terminal domain-containing protein [Kineosporia sp. A_224]|uniref:PLDc N-terminal domain-containing protein n=1 Tax=Kineosporia sp. A_224 TaxID=1962180 RepID=UPI000B4BA706|nr:PLDc N-terminal domain-containing protein [Kineosporia sp. A_224]